MEEVQLNAKLLTNVAPPYKIQTILLQNVYEKIPIGPILTNMTHIFLNLWPKLGTLERFTHLLFLYYIKFCIL